MKKQIILPAIAVLAYFPGYAQSVKDSGNTKNIDDVVIVASRKPTKISDIPGTVWVVPKDKIELQAKNGVPIKEMLSILIPSLDIGPQGRTNYGQNMRGRSALVMIDGVSLNSIRAISRQLTPCILLISRELRFFQVQARYMVAMLQVVLLILLPKHLLKKA